MDIFHVPLHVSWIFHVWVILSASPSPTQSPTSETPGWAEESALAAFFGVPALGVDGITRFHVAGAQCSFDELFF